MNGKFCLIVAIFATCVSVLDAHSWSTDDMDLFDVVEDVNENFYDFLGISENATTSDIRKAYRKLSLQFHPDKNPDADAPEKFRKIVSVVEVLKDEKKRAKYHEVLEHGLPDWRSALYYYRRARKMGFKEMIVILTTVSTIGQTLWMWASYWEKTFTIESNVREAIQRKKSRSTNAKKNKAAEDEINKLREEWMSHIVKPKWSDMWFCQLPMWLFALMMATPALVKDMMKPKEPEVEDESEEEDEEERPKKVRTQRQVKAVEVVNGSPVVSSSPSNKTSPEIKKVLKTGKWTEIETAALIKALKKFPAGTTDRWEKIGELLERSSQDICEKVKQLRNTQGNIIPNAQNHAGKSLSVASELSKKDDPYKPDDGDDSPEATEWSQEQQKQLEKAMIAYPKGTETRWEVISDYIGDKTPEECIARVKWITERIKKKNQQQA